MRTIKAVHKAVYEPIGDLVTYRAMPTTTVPMNSLDPFIFLNHHGWQEYAPNNRGLPFGPHPHRGFETVTFILAGDLEHKDSGGGGSVIREGGVQWMTAGSGLVHAEISSDAFKAQGGPLEILQLWVNLPARFKMTPPHYTGLQKEDIPTTSLGAGKVTLHAVSGTWQNVKGPIEPLTDIALSFIEFRQGGSASFSVPREKTVFFYVVNGQLTVNETDAGKHHLVEFNSDGEEININAITDAIILFGYAMPFNEPFMAHGPFVMNTREEIIKAYDDYHKGLFGSETLP